ncbi:hypothetical protein QUF64_05315 [Anaerolineales bacterium HSG6]|nr:hypothetical protein [Anaerolineales bacterium HSG6]
MNITVFQSNKLPPLKPFVVVTITVGLMLSGLIITILLSQISIMPAKPARKAVVSMADHLGFALGFGETGTPGFPNPFNRHDPKKGNHINDNGRHIRNALKGIESNLKRNQTLRDFFQKYLSDREYQGLTQTLDRFIEALRNPNSPIYKQTDPKIRKEILEILTRTGYL